MPDVTMPRLSDSMEEGTILKWLKSDGDEVSKGEELVEIETDKANMTYEADESGTLEIVAQEGDTLSVGETIARIGEGGGGDSSDSDEDEESEEEPEAKEDEEEEEEESSDEDSDEDEEPEADAEEDEDEADEEEPAEDDEPEEDESDSGDEEAQENGRVKASPIARRMAREMGLELAGVKGTGPGGRIVKADIEAAAKQDDKPAEKEPEEKKDKEEPKREKAPAASSDSGRGDVTHEELSRLQRTVARRMAESKATAPDFVMTLEVDMEEAVQLRGQLKAAAGEDAPAPSFNDFVVKAAALALRDFPRANGAYRDGQFELYSRINIGVAVAGQDALVVPTVFDADKKSLGTIASESRGLAEKVREGTISPPELSAGTFTISNLGMYGIRRFTAVINPPQAAILAVGELTPRPVVRDGEVVVRAVMELTLSCDHRILYGADAAEFLGRIREYLETPLRLAL